MSRRDGLREELEQGLRLEMLRICFVINIIEMTNVRLETLSLPCPLPPNPILSNFLYIILPRVGVGLGGRWP